MILIVLSMAIEPCEEWRVDLGKVGFVKGKFEMASEPTSEA